MVVLDPTTCVQRIVGWILHSYAFCGEGIQQLSLQSLYHARPHPHELQLTIIRAPLPSGCDNSVVDG